VDDEQVTAAVAAVVAIATTIIVVLSVYAIIRLRNRFQQVTDFRTLSSAPKVFCDPMKTLPLPAQMGSPVQRTSMDETYM
jgi:ABC-type spermidine/putrescine transport system permease subunit II